MFGFSPVGKSLTFLRWLKFQILQAFCTYKDNLIRVLCMTVWPLSKNYLHTPIRCMCTFVQKQGFPPLFTTFQTIIKDGLLMIWLYLMHDSTWLTSWATSEFHSYVNLEVSYKFRKVPTSLWSLVNVWNFLRCWYICQVQPCIYGVK